MAGRLAFNFSYADMSRGNTTMLRTLNQTWRPPFSQWAKGRGCGFGNADCSANNSSSSKKQ